MGTQPEAAIPQRRSLEVADEPAAPQQPGQQTELPIEQTLRRRSRSSPSSRAGGPARRMRAYEIGRHRLVSRRHAYLGQHRQTFAVGLSRRCAAMTRGAILPLRRARPTRVDRALGCVRPGHRRAGARSRDRRSSGRRRSSSSCASRARSSPYRCRMSSTRRPIADLLARWRALRPTGAARRSNTTFHHRAHRADQRRLPHRAAQISARAPAVVRIDVGVGARKVAALEVVEDQARVRPQRFRADHSSAASRSASVQRKPLVGVERNPSSRSSRREGPPAASACRQSGAPSDRVARCLDLFLRVIRG